MQKIKNKADKKRHGCVTAWLGLLLIGVVFGLYVNISYGLYFMLLMTLINLVLIILLFQWKKIAFWGFVISCIIVFVYNMNYGVDTATAIGGLLSPLVLWAIFQFKSNGVSAWDNLED